MLLGVLNICDLKIIEMDSYIFLSKYTLIHCAYLCWGMLYRHSLLVTQIKLAEGVEVDLKIIYLAFVNSHQFSSLRSKDFLVVKAFHIVNALTFLLRFSYSS